MSWEFALLNPLYRNRGAAGVALPYILNFATSPDGALPTGWTGATWAIASGQAVNTPTESAEMLTNPGFEGTYVAGVAPNWTQLGTLTLAESADVHGGSSAQSVTNTNSSLNRVNQTITSVVGSWQKRVVWAKLAGGAGQGRMVQGSIQAIALAVGAAYAQYVLTMRVTTTSEFFGLYASAVGATVLYDDASSKVLTGLYATIETQSADVIVKAPWTIASGSNLHAGVIARSDGTLDNCLLATYNRVTSKVELVSYLAGVPTELVSSTVAYSAGANVELRCNGATVQLFYNDAQVGTDQTDSNHTTRKFHGLFSTGIGATTTSFSVSL